MTITRFDSTVVSPRDEMIFAIMGVLDDAIDSDEAIGVHELAVRILILVEELQAA